MTKRTGSAILLVLVAIAVIGTLALWFVNSKSQRSGFARFMSDETKLEALAESATEFLLAKLKASINKHDYSDDVTASLYHLVRQALPVKSTKPGRNHILDTESALTVSSADVNLVGIYKSALDPLVVSYGWQPSDVTYETEISLATAENFAPKDSYKVCGADSPHQKAEGSSAKFLDAADMSELVAENDGDYDSAPLWAPSGWYLSFNLPVIESPHKHEFEGTWKVSGDGGAGELTQLTDARKEIEQKLANPDLTTEQRAALQQQLDNAINEIDNFKTSGKTLKVTVSITKNGPAKFSTHFTGKIKIMGITFTLDRAGPSLDINAELKEHCPFLKCIDDMSQPVKSLRKHVFTDSSFSKLYKADDFVALAKTRLDEVKKYHNIDTGTQKYVEKGTMLQFKTTVTHNQAGKKSSKTLVAQIPLKVTDVQPVAPEYSLFVANSNLLSEGSLPGLGEKIDLNDWEPRDTPEKAIGQFIVHNYPATVESGKTKANLAPLFKNACLPGMVRVNAQTSTADEAMILGTFVGTFDEPELTELNAIVSPSGGEGNSAQANDSRGNLFRTEPSFIWRTKDDNLVPAPSVHHELELPVLFTDAELDTSSPIRDIPDAGLAQIANFFKSSAFNLQMKPTLLSGNANMEYPLGIAIEGPINRIFSRIRVQVRPSAHASLSGVIDLTRIRYNYEHISRYSDNIPRDFSTAPQGKHARYGMHKYKPAIDNKVWNSNSDYKYMPMNCYSTLQYAKKASRFYSSASDFVSDMGKAVDKGGLKNSDGSIMVNGVYFIDGGLDLGGQKFKGNGLIVAKGTIKINGNITRADDKTTLGLIARRSFIHFGPSCSRVEAACFSNEAPFSSGQKLHIDGNLVTNDFKRTNLLDVHVCYNSRACSVSPLATLRNLGKFEPKRYWVSAADNWAKTFYEKKSN